MHILNSRADLDSLAGTPAFTNAISMLNGSRAIGLSVLRKFGFLSEHEWESYIQAAGHPLDKPDPVPKAPEATIAEIRVGAKAKLASRRYKIEVGGIEIAGTPVATDRQSQAMLIAALVQLGADETVQWKGPDGVFRPITRDQLAAVARAVKEHIQACFAREAELVHLIDQAGNEEMTALEGVIQTFWPARV